MSRRLIGVLLGVLVGSLVTLSLGASTAVSATPDDSPPTTTSAATTTFENVFLPEDENISDCISAVPQPGCGSSARGGWRQTLVFVVIIAGLALIGWRILRSVRRNRPGADTPGGQDGAGA